MNYAEQQRSPGKHVVGIAFVLALHAFLAWAAITGLARKAIDVVKAPFETKIIEEVKPPPPPDTPPPPPPKMVQLPQVFVPPPEVQISAPAVRAPAITPTTTVAPVFRAPAPPAPPAPVAPPAPPSVGVACPNSQSIRSEIKYPVQARREGLQGEVLVEFTVAVNGEIKDIEVKNSSNRAFNTVSMNAVRQFRCTAQARDVRVQVPFSFKLTD